MVKSVCLWNIRLERVPQAGKKISVEKEAGRTRRSSFLQLPPFLHVNIQKNYSFFTIQLQTIVVMNFLTACSLTSWCQVKQSDICYNTTFAVSSIRKARHFSWKLEFGKYDDVLYILPRFYPPDACLTISIHHLWQKSWGLSWPWLGSGAASKKYLNITLTSIHGKSCYSSKTNENAEIKWQ